MSTTSNRRSDTATKALLAGSTRSQPGKENAVEEFLRSAQPLVEQQPGPKPWLAVRLSPSRFRIIAAFPDQAARETRLDGPVGKALGERADELFAAPPEIKRARRARQ
ncbi:putative quinol monooxygenase [Nocardia rhamnosiphila]|uniref:putative quinol monooxygenase n=1 Tax=Nocardia rhamnosiphila TaxID=426716 RepID=UPI003F4CDD36